MATISNFTKVQFFDKNGNTIKNVGNVTELLSAIDDMQQKFQNVDIKQKFQNVDFSALKEQNNKNEGIELGN